MALFGNLNDIPELEPVPAGEEYDCRIVAAKKFDNRIAICVEVVGEENCPDFWHTLWFPKEDDTKKQAALTNRKIVDFLEACGLDLDIEDVNDFVDAEFTAKLGIDDYQGVETNKIINVT